MFPTHPRPTVKQKRNYLQLRRNSVLGQLTLQKRLAHFRGEETLNSGQSPVLTGLGLGMAGMGQEGQGPHRSLGFGPQPRFLWKPGSEQQFLAYVQDPFLSLQDSPLFPAPLPNTPALNLDIATLDVRAVWFAYTT